MVDIIEADASHEEAIQAQEEMEEILEPLEPEPEKTVEKLTDRQPTAEEFKAMDGARKAFEKENKRLKDELKAHKSQPFDGDPMVSVALGKALVDISLEEAETIVTYAKGKFNNLKPTPEQIIQASKDPWIMDAITAKREKVKSENKTPNPSSPAPLIGGKTADDVAGLSTKDFAKLARDSFGGGRTGI